MKRFDMKTHRRLAFTLFEIMAVILIIGIAAAYLVPAVGSNIRSPKLRQAANALASDIEYCMSECITRPTAARGVLFDLTNNKYTLEVVSTGSAITFPGDGLSYVNDFATGRSTQFSGVRLSTLVMGSGTLTLLTFDSYGHPVITADFVITLTYNGASLKVTVKQYTGDVTITDG